MKRWIVGAILVGVGFFYWYTNNPNKIHKAPSEDEAYVYKNATWEAIGSNVNGDTAYAELTYYDPNKDVVHGWYKVIYSTPEYTSHEITELSVDKDDQDVGVAIPYPNVEPTETSYETLLFTDCKTLDSHSEDRVTYAGSSPVSSLPIPWPKPYHPGTISSVAAKYLCKGK